MTVINCSQSCSQDILKPVQAFQLVQVLTVQLQFKLLKMQNEPLQRCDNCLNQFPESKMATHFGYCRRNIKKCPDCNQMFDVNFKDQHEQQYHKKISCPHCSKSFPSAEFKIHEKNCTQKPIYCEHCDLNVPVNSYPTHLKACEARTKPCTRCNFPIMNKDYYSHIVSCQGVREQPKQVLTYQQHIQQQRRTIQQNINKLQKVNSKEKIIVPSYQSKNAQNKDYASKVQRISGQQPRLINNYPAPRQQFQVQDKKQYSNKQPQPNVIKKQQVRRYPVTIHPPATTFTYGNSKKQDPGPIRRLPNQNPPVYNPISYVKSNSNGRNNPNEHGSKGNGSVQPTKQNTISRQQQPKSYKEISSMYEAQKGVGVISSKPIERKYQHPTIPKKEQKPIAVENLQQTKYQRIKAPQVTQRVIYQNKYPQPTYQLNRQHNFNESYGVGIQEDPELQMAIMQSLGQGGKLNKRQNDDFQIQMLNESFIQQQKVIQAQLKNKKK